MDCFLFRVLAVSCFFVLPGLHSHQNGKISQMMREEKKKQDGNETIDDNNGHRLKDTLFLVGYIMPVISFKSRTNF